MASSSPTKKLKAVSQVIIAPPAAVPLTPDSVSKTTLVYWNIRGLAQSCRLALEYVGESYDDVRIEAGEAGTKDFKQNWFSVKNEVDIPFPNLPYFFDGEVKISQSCAILRHIARKHNLTGSTPVIAANVDMVMDVLVDYDATISRMCYGNFIDGGKEAWIESTMKPTLRSFEAHLSKSKFIAADEITITDFKAYEEFDKTRIIAPEEFEKFPLVSAYLTNLKALPGVSEYLASDKYIERPINNPHAQFK